MAFLPPAALPITRKTAFRATGDVPFAIWERAFGQVGSTLKGDDLRACYEAARGITVMVLDRFRAESYFATTAVARNNFLGLRVPTSATEFMAFETPAACVRELIRRWTDASYKSGVYMPRDLSIAGMITKYSPPHENDTEALIRACVDHLNAWRDEAEDPTPRPVDPSDRWRPYPYPKMVDLIVQKPDEGAGFDRVPFRHPLIRGFCSHITDGNASIEWYRDFFSTGGERAWDALTDLVFGQDGRIGLLNDWRDPQRGGTRAGWANGGVNGLEGEGLAFYRMFPAINIALVSGEHVARSGQAWSDALIAATIEVRTAIAQELRCPWQAYPYHPNYGGVSIEQQHRNFATKACPANPYISTYDALIRREVKRKLEAWQGGQGGDPVQPAPAWQGPLGLPLDFFRNEFGLLRRYDEAGTHLRDYPFDPKGTISLAWLNRGAEEGLWPEAEEWRVWDSTLAPGKEQWVSFEGGWKLFCPIDNQRAGWTWLDRVEMPTKEQ